MLRLFITIFYHSRRDLYFHILICITLSKKKKKICFRYYFDYEFKKFAVALLKIKSNKIFIRLIDRSKGYQSRCKSHRREKEIKVTAFTTMAQHLLSGHIDRDGIYTSNQSGIPSLLSLRSFTIIWLLFPQITCLSFRSLSSFFHSRISPRTFLLSHRKLVGQTF